MKTEQGFTSVEFSVVLVFLVVGLVIAVGWVKNLYELSNCDFQAPYKCEVIHAVGIIPPVGAVTAWLDVGK